MKCIWCKKDFTPKPSRPTQRFCCSNCREEYHEAQLLVKRKVKTILLKHGDYHVEEEQLKKIIKAKILIFGPHLKQIHQCPCDALNQYRYCGSDRCIQDIEEEGHCHCNLFWKHFKGEKQ